MTLTFKVRQALIYIIPCFRTFLHKCAIMHYFLISQEPYSVLHKQIRILRYAFKYISSFYCVIMKIFWKYFHLKNIKMHFNYSIDLIYTNVYICTGHVGL